MATILRGIYTRYMRLYERYFEDIDALNDDKISELRKYNEETESLIKHYYMDIPLEIIMEIKEFDDDYTAKLLGTGRHEYLLGIYENFRKASEDDNSKAEFAKQALTAFYGEMDSIFREGFGTGSETTKDTVSGLMGLLFGKEEK